MTRQLPGLGEQNWGLTLNNWLMQIGNSNGGGINTFAGEPTGLTTDDQGYTFVDTNTSSLKRWNGSSFDVLVAGGAATSAVADDFVITDANDPTAGFRFDGSNISPGQTRVITVPDYDGTLATLDGVETLTNKTLTSPVVNVGSDAPGDIYYRDAGGNFARLPIGTADQVLRVSGGFPAWTDTTSITATASNVGGGAGVFKQKTGNDLEFKSIVAGSTKVSVTDNTDDVTIDVVEANINHDNLAGAGTNNHAAIDTFIASKGNADGIASLGADSKVPLAQLPASVKGGFVVADITGRDAIVAGDRYEGMRVDVLDASGDATVDSGIARYVLTSDLTNGGWVKTSEGESMDLDTSVFFNKTSDTLDDINAGSTNVHLTTILKTNYDAAHTHSQVTSGNPHGVTAAEVGLGNVTNDAQLRAADLVTTIADDDTKVPSAGAVFDGLATKQDSLGFTPEDSANKGQPGGYAPLDGGSKIPTSYMPDTMMGALIYQGAWDADTNAPDVGTASASNKGHYYKVSVQGTTDKGGVTDWKVGDWLVSNGTTWDKIDNTESVTSVNGKVGAVVLDNSDLNLNFLNLTDTPGAYSTAGDVVRVNGTNDGVELHTLTKADVGLGNVDNTADADKPVSTAVQTAIDGKEDVITAGTTTQYYRGDKTWQTLDNAAVGLGNVTNDAQLRADQLIDEDNMVSDSAAHVPTQQSVKAYVDGAVAGAGKTAGNGIDNDEYNNNDTIVVQPIPQQDGGIQVTNGSETYLFQDTGTTAAALYQYNDGVGSLEVNSVVTSITPPAGAYDNVSGFNDLLAPIYYDAVNDVSLVREVGMSYTTGTFAFENSVYAYWRLVEGPVGVGTSLDDFSYGAGNPFVTESQWGNFSPSTITPSLFPDVDFQNSYTSVSQNPSNQTIEVTANGIGVILNNTIGTIEEGDVADGKAMKDYVDGAVAGASVTASNGLTQVSGDIQLGGVLTSNTTLSGDTNTYSLSITEVTNFNISSQSSTYTDTNNTGGIRYAADYSTGFVGRSLVDKAYVDGAVAGVDLSGLVPYTGATGAVDLGSQNITTTGVMATNQLASTGAISSAIISISADITLDSTHHIVAASGASNTVMVTLPSAVGITGRRYIIKCTDLTNAVSVETTGIETIDGDANYLFDTQWENIEVVSDGTNWLVISAIGYGV